MLQIRRLLGAGRGFFVCKVAVIGKLGQLVQNDPMTDCCYHHYHYFHHYHYHNYHQYHHHHYYYHHYHYRSYWRTWTVCAKWSNGLQLFCDCYHFRYFTTHTYLLRVKKTCGLDKFLENNQIIGFVYCFSTIYILNGYFVITALLSR